MIDPRFEELSVPEMVSHVWDRMMDMDDGSPEQVLYLSQVLPIIHLANVENLMDIPAVELGKAAEWLDEF